MFFRNIFKELNDWKARPDRKPLIIRGARQVGKTSAVLEFGKVNFKNFYHLNLEKDYDRSLFNEVGNVSNFIQALELRYQRKVIFGETLLFIDEIQNSEIAINQLRYFYEEMPQLHVIAAGSLLEVKIKKEGFSIPVGRVEYCYMHPVTFDEFLIADSSQQMQDYINDIKSSSEIPELVHHELMNKYREYALIGGMPQVVDQYLRNRNILELNHIYEGLLTSFKDDVYKYTSSARSVYVQHIIEHAPQYAGGLITYENFGGSGYRSREMKEAFEVLEKAMIVKLIHASSSVKPPMMLNYRKSPKLLFLDTGIINYKLGIQKDLLNIENLSSVYRGQIAEQIVGQALNSSGIQRLTEVAYWFRNKPGATSQMDFLILGNRDLIPIEVKSGKAGKMKSLHQFIEMNNLNTAMRIYGGKLLVDDVTTPTGKHFTLLSIPFYLAHRIKHLVG